VKKSESGSLTNSFKACWVQDRALLFLISTEFEQNVRNSARAEYPEYPHGEKTKERFSLFHFKINWE
jgi:hypothetical protein